ncbi:MAG: ABC transporter ATP-binding protein [Tissierellia bacterium]|nr:ABC transporter ATP-binding protein [Tissierellia bacterium]
MKKDTILELKNLEVSYGPINAIKGINMRVKRGEIVAILGSNGAGKTTTLRTISGLEKPKAGEIVFQDTSIGEMEPEKITSLGISQSPEGRQIFPDLTVYENLSIGAYVLKDKRKIKENYEKCFNFFPVLKERRQQIAATLSGGEQQMLAIARALMSSPELLLLDEPSLGLAPLIVEGIMNIIKDIAKEGTTVVIVEQNAAQTLKIADYGYVLELGLVSFEGSAKELLENPRLVESYLGGKK